MKYRFKLQNILADPLYSDSLNIEYNRELWYYRKSLKGVLTFIGRDYTTIINSSFETEFEVILESSDDGSVWSVEWTGVFTKTDCKINEDDKNITVEPRSLDNYTELLAGLSKEIDILKLSPEIQSLDIDIRPIIQIYVPGDSVVSCFLGSEFWEQQVRAVFTESILVNNYFFAKHTEVFKAYVAGSGVIDGYEGDYINARDFNDFTAVIDSWAGKNNERYVYQNTELVYNPETEEDELKYVYVITDSGGTEVQRSIFYDEAIEEGEVELICTAGTQGSIYLSITPVYMRYILNKAKLLGQVTYELYDYDFAVGNRNYTRGVGYLGGLVTPSAWGSEDPTEWGQRDDSDYFVRPQGGLGIWNDNTKPIARSTWGNSSVWFTPYSFDDIIEEAGREPFRFSQGIPIQEILNLLLAEIGSGLTHTTDDSEFLYADFNPVTFRANERLFLTQKSNLLNITFDQPAQKAIVTISEVLQMLQNTHRLYWYVDGTSLKIEHVSFFRQGGSYSQFPTPDIDLTQEMHVRNGKPWAFAKSLYSYEKTELEEEITCSWMDDVTNAFKGNNIIINSKFVERGKVEERTAGRFTSDIDYMFANPEELSKEGLAILSAKKTTVSFNEGASETEQTQIRTISNRAILANGEIADYYVSAMSVLVFETKQDELRHIVGEAPNDFMTWAYYSDYSLNNVVGTGRYVGTTGRSPVDELANTPTNANYIAITLEVASILKCNAFEAYKVGYTSKTIDTLRNVNQNGRLAFLNLQPDYMRYDLPSEDVTINGGTTFVYGVKRTKLQEVIYPSPTNINPLGLVKTTLGNGQIRKLNLNLSSGIIKAELEHDTY